MSIIFLDMLFSGVVQCAQKLATQHGACQALLAFWKHAMGNYHEAKKVITTIIEFQLPTTGLKNIDSTFLKLILRVSRGYY